MSVATRARAELRREARERQRELIPKLRADVRARRKAKKKRLAQCRVDCRKKARAIVKDAERARALLRLGIQRAKDKAREACKLCKVSAKGEELEKIDRALAAVQAEREAILELRQRAARTKDARGRAGGKRRQELRAESDDEVRRNVADDPELAALWDASNKSQFKETKTRSRTEAFVEWLGDHPEALDELRARQEVQYQREAEEMLERLPVATTKLEHEELDAFLADMKRVEQRAQPVPF